MILRALGDQPALGNQLDDLGDPDDSAWHLVERSQIRIEPPVLLIPQPAHAVLSGDLAEALLPEAFGELPATVLRAIRMHDTGWGNLDAGQIQRLRYETGPQDEKRHQRSSPASGPTSFLAVPSSEVVAAWKSSVDEMEKIAPECGCIVSRHFTLLALPGDRVHAAFAKQETLRQERIQKSAGLNAADLERWTDALGFCDLLSLYLCSGVAAEASLPRVHPARQAAATLRIHQNREELKLSEPLIRRGTRVEIHGLRHPAPASGSAAECLRWTLA